jgi:hypothetical protein
MKLIAIIHPGRCGSTLLEKIISELDILHFGEIFSPANIYNSGLKNRGWKSYTTVNDFLLAIVQIANIQASYKGSRFSRCEFAFLEAKLNNYELKPFSGISDLVSSELILGSVFLYSANYLRRYISLLRAQVSGIWHVEKSNHDYQPGLVSPDFSSITDPDIFGLFELSLSQAVRRYKYILEIQAGIVREICHSLGKPFIPIKYEDLVVNPDALAKTIADVICNFGIMPDSGAVQEDILTAISRIALKKTGFENLLDGLSSEALSNLELIPNYKEYLPGGSFDLDIPDWY